jgi:hypothetical protein
VESRVLEAGDAQNDPLASVARVGHAFFIVPMSDAKAWDGQGTYKGSSDDVINVKGSFDKLDSMKFK